jgi:hypothetical protein
MKITFKRTFRSTGKNNPASKGKLRFGYEVSGTKEELADFEASRGDFFIKDEDGTPIYNSLQYVGKSTNLIKTQDGRYIADTSAIDTANSLAEQFPFLASELAKDVLKQIQPSAATVSVTAKAADLTGK